MTGVCLAKYIKFHAYGYGVIDSSYVVVIYTVLDCICVLLLVFKIFAMHLLYVSLMQASVCFIVLILS